MIHVSAPGKIMISGEWSVLEPGNACIAAAVNKRVHAKIEELPSEGPQPKVVISLDDFGIKEKAAAFDGNHLLFSQEPSEPEREQLNPIKEAIEVSMKYIQQAVGGAKSFSIQAWSELLQITVDGQAKKIGFGSSATMAVAAIAAILELHGVHAEEKRDVVYKLTCASRLSARIGSAFDVAASTYGGMLSYIAPNSKWLSQQLQASPVKTVVESRWPLLHIQSINVMEELVLSVGWVKQYAETSTMLHAMEVWKESNASHYDGIIEEVSETVDKVLQAFRLKDRESILEAIKKNRAKLAELTAASGVPVETEDLKRLAEIADQAGAAGKLSGAGGGNFGIALCFDEHTAEGIKDAWKQAGLYPLDVRLDESGVRVERSV